MVQFTGVVNLTHTLSLEFPSFSGSCEAMVEVVKQLDRDGVNVKR